MIKGLTAENPETLADGLRNATWDVCMVSQWGRSLRVPEAPFGIFAQTIKRSNSSPVDYFPVPSLAANRTCSHSWKLAGERVMRSG